MAIEHFDTLKTNIEEFINKYRQMRFQIIKLEKENIELKKRIQLVEQNDNSEHIKKLEKFHFENERLREKNSQVKNQIKNLIHQLEKQKLVNHGVDS